MPQNQQKQGPAGQRCVHGRIKHMKHIKYTQHIQQYQWWTDPMIFIEKTAPFRRLKKNRLPSNGPTNGPTNRPTDGHDLI